MLVAFVVEALGDAKINQLELALVVDQHIAGFDVPVQDQMPVRVRYRIAQVEQKLHAWAQAELVLTAMAEQVLAVDQFHRIPELTSAAFATVDKSGDVWMAQARHHIAFEQEALPPGGVDLRGGDPLDGHTLSESLGLSLALGHDAHTTSTKLANQGERAELGRQVYLGPFLLPAALQPMGQAVKAFQHAADQNREFGLHLGEFGVDSGAVAGIDFQQLAKQLERSAFGVGAVGHGYSRRVGG